jgi:alkylated DNA repair protein alkB family protein 6
MVDYYKLWRLERQHLLNRNKKVDTNENHYNNHKKFSNSMGELDSEEQNDHLPEHLKIKVTSNEKFSLNRSFPFKVLDPTFRVGTISSIYYVPDFITETEETLLLQHIFHKSNNSKWVKLKTRRLQNWGGTPELSGMVPEALPPWFDDLAMRLISSGVYSETTKPNHLLINLYEEAQGIMPHKDGPLYYPRVAIITLNGSARIDFQEQVNSTPQNSLLLLPCSLLVFEHDAYTRYFHSIPFQLMDNVDETVVNWHATALPIGFQCLRTLRVSLTILYVPNVVS